MHSFNTIGPGDASTLAPPFSGYVNVYDFNSSQAAQAIVWPNGSAFCNIDAPAAWYARVGGTAAAPAAAVSDGTASARNPTQRQRGPNEQSFSLISPTAQYVTIEFWGSSEIG